MKRKSLAAVTFTAAAFFIAIAMWQGSPLPQQARAIVSAPAQAQGPTLFRYYVPHEPAQERLLARQNWTVFELIAQDFQLPLASVLAANALTANQPVAPGTTLVVPVAEGYSWNACASYYGAGDGANGHVQADGTIFHAADISVAMKELPKGSYVTISFPVSGLVVKHVPVRDSGPYYATCPSGLPRAVDLSLGLAKESGLPLSRGLFRVKVTLESIPTKYLVNKPPGSP